MLQYANAFSCVMKEDASEVIIQFRQSFPVIDNDGKIVSTGCEDIAAVVLTLETAKELVTIMGDVMSRDVNFSQTNTQSAQRK